VAVIAEGIALALSGFVILGIVIAEGPIVAAIPATVVAVTKPNFLLSASIRL
jgi:hypothetical protein